MCVGFLFPKWPCWRLGLPPRARWESGASTQYCCFLAQHCSHPPYTSARGCQYSPSLWKVNLKAQMHKIHFQVDSREVDGNMDFILRLNLGRSLDTRDSENAWRNSVIGFQLCSTIRFLLVKWGVQQAGASVSAAQRSRASWGWLMAWFLSTTFQIATVFMPRSKASLLCWSSHWLPPTLSASFLPSASASMGPRRMLSAGALQPLNAWGTARLHCVHILCGQLEPSGIFYMNCCHVRLISLNLI